MRKIIFLLIIIGIIIQNYPCLNCSGIRNANISNNENEDGNENEEENSNENED
jgi:hypothetical protein